MPHLQPTTRPHLPILAGRSDRLALAVSYVDTPDQRRLRYQFALAFLAQMSLARTRRPSR